MWIEDNHQILSVNTEYKIQLSIPKDNAAVGEEEKWTIRCKDQFL